MRTHVILAMRTHQRRAMQYVRRPVKSGCKWGVFATQPFNRAKLVGKVSNRYMSRVARGHQRLKRASEIGKHGGNLGPGRNPQPSRCLADRSGLVSFAANERGADTESN